MFLTPACTSYTFAAIGEVDASTAAASAAAVGDAEQWFWCHVPFSRPVTHAVWQLVPISNLSPNCRLCSWWCSHRGSNGQLPFLNKFWSIQSTRPSCRYVATLGSNSNVHLCVSVGTGSLNSLLCCVQLSFSYTISTTLQHIDTLWGQCSDALQTVTDNQLFQFN